MAEAKGNITEFRISLRDRECLKPRFVGVLEPIKDRIHQSDDFSDVYYTPSDVYAELEAMCVAAVGKLRFLKTISTESVVVLHCSTCLLYTSDAADELLCVDLGGRRIIK